MDTSRNGKCGNGCSINSTRLEILEASYHLWASKTDAPRVPEGRNHSRHIRQKQNIKLLGALENS